VVVRDHDLRQQLMVAARGQRQVGAAPVVFVLYSDMSDVLNTPDEIIDPSADSDRRAAAKHRSGATGAASPEQVAQWGWRRRSSRWDTCCSPRSRSVTPLRRCKDLTETP
jgi:hypothetical protein